MAIDTVIFDLDGTLLYTIEDLSDSVNAVLTNYGYPACSIDDVMRFVGNGVELLMERALPDGKNCPHFYKCVELFKNEYKARMYDKTRPYEGVIDLLSKMKSQGYNISVLSNKFDGAVKELCKRYFDGLVDYAVGQSESVSVKPSTDGVKEIMSYFGVDKDRCIIVGDSEVDIETANNSNIPCISVTWGYKSIDFLYKHGAGVLVYTPDEILELV